MLPQLLTVLLLQPLQWPRPPAAHPDPLQGPLPHPQLLLLLLESPAH